MSFGDFFREYFESRRHNVSMWVLFFGSILCLLIGIIQSPGRRLGRISQTHRPRRLTMRPRYPPTAASLLTEREPSPSAFRQFMFLFRIAFPSIQSQEVGTLMIVSFLLLLKTYFSLRLASFSSGLSRTIIKSGRLEMLKGVFELILWYVPSTITKSSLSYCIEMLQLQVRSNLTQHFHNKYLNDTVFFRLLGSEDLVDIDQRITKDVAKWSNFLCATLVPLLNPFIDIILFSRLIAKNSGFSGPLITFTYYTGCMTLLSTFSPEMEDLVNEETERDGAFVSGHQRLVPFAEEIVLSQGQQFHTQLMNRLFLSIANHRSRKIYLQSIYGFLHAMLMRHGSNMISSVICVQTIFSEKADGLSPEDLVGLFVGSFFSFRKLDIAMRQLLSNFPKVFVLKSLSRRLYAIEEGVDRVVEETFLEVGPETAVRMYASTGSPTGIIKGFVRGEHIEFDRVPLELPNGDVLCEELSFFVKPGMNLLIVGPNGCGKSSTIRLLGGLWPLRGGRITKPSNEQIYYVPQRPYISSGSLRDQITYPFRSGDIGASDSTLFNCLEMATLEDIFSNPDITWSSCLAWDKDMLSVADKQKLAMARLFFHRPRFAILDECSSMMDIEVEERMYKTCHTLGISLITIAHRVSVWRHHNWILRFDGMGNYLFSPLKFDEEGEMILTKVVYASNPDDIGQEFRFTTPRDEEEDL